MNMGKSGYIPYLPLTDLLWLAQEVAPGQNGLAIQGQSQCLFPSSRSSDKVTRLPLDSQIQRCTIHLFDQLQLSLEEASSININACSHIHVKQPISGFWSTPR
jgi:hypothetical protein